MAVRVSVNSHELGFAFLREFQNFRGEMTTASLPKSNFPAWHRWFPPAFAVIGTTLLALGAWLWLRDADASLWGTLPLGKAGLEPEYCELNRMDAAVRQPVNAWSNLFYAVWGFWILGWAIVDTVHGTGDNAQRRHPALTAWLGLMQVGLSGGSFFFHASLTQLGQHWDMAFTYGLALGLCASGIFRVALLRGWPENGTLRWATLLLAIASAVLLYLIKWSVDGKVALPVMMLTGVGLVVYSYFQIREKLPGWLLLLAILFLVLSGLFRSLDLAKVGCQPEGILQFHALWHLCTGLSGFLFLAVFRAEKP